MDDIHSRLRLHRCQLPFPVLQALLNRFKTAAAIFQANSAELQPRTLNQQAPNPALSQAQIQRLQQERDDEVSRDLAWLDKTGHDILFIDDPRYPAQLKTLSDPPFALYTIGDTDYLHQPQLAMVGSRNASAAGLKTARDFAEHLSAAGITITSGLAQGIDAACHQGAIGHIGGSVAVVANGLHTIYPKSNTALAAALADNGCIISEAPIGADPLRASFPQRNRIISGLSLGTLVVEAALKSGSLITSRHALEQGREVFAIPGSIHNPLAKGCHSLIKSGAKLVESADDILEELFPLVNSSAIRHTSAPECTETGPDTDGKTSYRAQPDSRDTALDEEYQTLLKHLEFEPVGIDELVERSQLKAADIASMLLILELQGQVVSKHGLFTRTGH